MCPGNSSKQFESALIKYMVNCGVIQRALEAIKRMNPAAPSPKLEFWDEWREWVQENHCAIDDKPVSEWFDELVDIIKEMKSASGEIALGGIFYVYTHDPVSRGVLEDFFEGIFSLWKLEEAEDDWLEWVDGQMKGARDRIGDIRPITVDRADKSVDKSVDRFVASRLRDANRSYIFGIYGGAVVLCRAVLEGALYAALKLDAVKRSNLDSLDRCIKVFDGKWRVLKNPQRWDWVRKTGFLSRDRKENDRLAGLGEKVTGAGADAVHPGRADRPMLDDPSRVTKPDALTAIQNTREILFALLNNSY
ncbi:MAG: hypothetical protein AABZ64_12400 [Nitrospinota bacterium]